jgi:hypothetical protein
LSECRSGLPRENFRPWEDKFYPFRKASGLAGFRTETPLALRRLSGLAPPSGLLDPSVDDGFDEKAQIPVEVGCGKLAALQESVNRARAATEVLGEFGDAGDVVNRALHKRLFTIGNRIYRPKEHGHLPHEPKGF